MPVKSPIKILLAVGHGIQPNGVWDPGARNAGVDLDEQSAGDIVVGMAAAILEASGHFAVRSEARLADDPNWVGTARNANAWGADVVVSVHHDWTGGVDGAHGFYYLPAEKALGDAILSAIGDAGFNVRRDWFRSRPELGLLRTTDAPTFLLECGRIGSKALDEPAELRAMGVALAAGILDHYDLPTNQEDDMPLSDTDVQRVATATAAAVATRPLPYTDDGVSAEVGWSRTLRTVAGLNGLVARIARGDTMTDTEIANTVRDAAKDIDVNVNVTVTPTEEPS